MPCEAHKLLSVCIFFFASYTLLDICCLLLKLQKVSKENYFYRDRISLTASEAASTWVSDTGR